MARSVEHIVETHRIAMQRRKVGRPVWDRTLDVSVVFHNDNLSFEQKRAAIVRVLKASGWAEKNESIEELIWEFENVKSIEEFDEYWDCLYDEADYDRVWIKTI